MSDQEPIAGRVVTGEYGHIPHELERAILHAVLVHGRPAGDDPIAPHLDDVTGQVQAGSVRLRIIAGRVRVSWGELVKPDDPASAVVLAGAWVDGDHIRRVIERWQDGLPVNGRKYGNEAE